MTTVTIYDAEKVGDIFKAQSVQLVLFASPVEFRSYAAVILTEKTGMGEEPDRITISTMSQQFTYINPRLVFCSNQLLVLSALSDYTASGTLQKIKKFYIMMENT